MLVLLLVLSALVKPVASRPNSAVDLSTFSYQNVELLGHTGGSCRVVSFSGDRLLISQGPRVTLVDVSDPSHPVAGASLLFPTIVRDIAADARLAVVLAGGLWTVDVGATDSLSVSGHLAVSGNGVCLYQDHVLLPGPAPHLQIVDIREPSVPRLVGTFDIPADAMRVIDATDIAVSGEDIYLSYTLRFRQPGFPVLGGFVVLRLSNPKVPDFLANFSVFFPVGSIAVDDNRAYMPVANRLVVIDVSNPRAPVQETVLVGPASPLDVLAENSRIYIPASGGLIWTFVRRPNGSIDRIENLETVGQGLHILDHNGNVYVAGGWAGLRVHRHEENQPTIEVGRLTFLTDAQDVAIHDGLAYVANGNMGASVIDLADPDAPEELGAVPTEDYAQAVCLVGNLLQVADNAGGVWAFEAKPDGSLPFVDQFRTVGPARDVAPLGGFVLVAEAEAGMSLLLTNPDGPASEFGRFAGPQTADSVVGDLDRVFVGDRLGRSVWVLNVTNPAAPKAISLVRTRGIAADIAYDGLRLAVAEQNSGLGLYEVIRDRLPNNLPGFEMPGRFEGVALSGNIAYVADSIYGLRVINVLNREDPAEAGYFRIPGIPHNATVAQDGRVYLAAGEAGLYVFQYNWSPDLAIRKFDFSPQDVNPGDIMSLTGIVRNESTVPTRAGAWIDVLVAEDPGFEGPRRRLCQRVRIEPGFSASDPIDLSELSFVVLSVPNGVYRVGIVLDSDNEVAEFREDNNFLWISHRPIYVGPRPANSRTWRRYR